MRSAVEVGTDEREDQEEPDRHGQVEQRVVEDGRAVLRPAPVEDVPVRALIPVSASSGILGILAKVIPMTYSIDLARNIFYRGRPEYSAAVLHDPLFDLAVTIGFFLVFTLVGTYLFVRADRNR